MANNCLYDMRITGHEKDIKELLSVMKWEGKYTNDGLGRIFSVEANEICDTNIPEIKIIDVWGDCAWSVLTAMCDGNGRNRSLESESERLNLAVEVFSSEPGCQFQEHYLIVQGDVVINECVDYEEHWIEGYGSLEKYNKEFGTNFTPDMINENGDVCIGGYGEDYGVFEDATHYFTKVKELISVQLDELDVCALYDYEDEYCSIVKAPNGKYFNYYSKDALIHRYGSAGPFETFEEAEKVLFKHRPVLAAAYSNLDSRIALSDAAKHINQPGISVMDQER